MQRLSQPSQWSHGVEVRLREITSSGVEARECLTVTLVLNPTTIRTARINLRSFQINIIRDPSVCMLIIDPAR